MPMPNTAEALHEKVAALCSGGLDSAVMLALLSDRFEQVFPVYVRCGLPWEEMEMQFLDDFLHGLGRPNIHPCQVLDFPMRDVYRQAWYGEGDGIPGYDEPDERWEIPGRNLILLSKTAVWCALNSIRAVALGSLGSNPFPDAGAGFFNGLEALLEQGLGVPIRILRPLQHLTKAEVIRLGSGLPLELTLTCASPVGRKHCGACGKCRERIEAFQAAGLPDPAPYHHSQGSAPCPR